MLNNLIWLLKKLALLLVLFTICRLLFLIMNWGFFTPIDIWEVFKSFLFGIRFDYSALFYINIPFIVLHFIPGKIQQSVKFQLLVKVLFVIVNSVALIPNLIDLRYFEFINKRSNADLIKLFSVSEGIFGSIPAILRDYWYISLFLILLVIALTGFYPRYKTYALKRSYLARNLRLTTILSWFIFILTSVWLVRGFELKPLRLIATNDYVKPQYAPLILNTPFSIIFTLKHNPENSYIFINDGTLVELYDPRQQYNLVTNELSHHKHLSSRTNVIIIILESFSKEYIGALNNYKTPYTPFLDSIIGQGYVMTNAYANSKRSIEALPAIFGSLPALTDNPYISSQYSNNKHSALPALLKKYGYVTSFFHGGTNGTMGFDKYCKAAGIDQYYGKKEFVGPSGSDDGDWGIFDEEFLQFFAEQLTHFDQPFFSSVFTLTSHHPYPIPEKYENKFISGTLPIYTTVQYTDFALRRFFETASKMSWYKNTLFIITSDHTAQAAHYFYKYPPGNFAIPIIFYLPGNEKYLKGIKDDKLAQQVDIYPTVADLLGIKDSIVSFGKSVFDTTKSRFIVNRYQNSFVFINDSCDGVFTEDRGLINLYNYKKDSFLINNLIDSNLVFKNQTDSLIESYIQEYFLRLTTNTLDQLIEISPSK